MNLLPLFKLICKFCADSQNQEPSVGWGYTGIAVMIFNPLSQSVLVRYSYVLHTYMYMYR